MSPDRWDDWEWEQISGHSDLTEGPAWDGSGLLYSECAANKIWRFDPDTSRSEVWRDGTNGANGLAFDRYGSLFACEGQARRVVRYGGNGVTKIIVDLFEGKRFNEPNDLAIDTEGRIWFSDPNYNMYGNRPMDLDHESVYRADPQPNGSSYSTTRVTRDTERPNGVLLSESNNTLYVADSPRAPGNYYGGIARDAPRQLYSYQIFADGTLDDFNVWHDFGPGRGIDGMCIDQRGHIVATAGHHASGPGPMIYVFGARGRVMSTHPTPADRPTNCAFGGQKLDILFVTFGGGEVYRVVNTGLSGTAAF